MKVLVNGGINLSELNGWWTEATRLKWGGRWGTAWSMMMILPGMLSKPMRFTICASPIMGQSADKWSSGSASLVQQWAGLRFGEVKVETKDNQHVYEVQIYLNGLEPESVRVELYADGVKGDAPVRQVM